MQECLAHREAYDTRVVPHATKVYVLHWSGDLKPSSSAFWNESTGMPAHIVNWTPAKQPEVYEVRNLPLPQLTAWALLRWRQFTRTAASALAYEREWGFELEPARGHEWSPYSLGKSTSGATGQVQGASMLGLGLLRSWIG